jgi:hypothetical protein
MNYPSDISIILNVTLPEGYIVESVPEPIRFTTENGGVPGDLRSQPISRQIECDDEIQS